MPVLTVFYWLPSICKIKSILPIKTSKASKETWSVNIWLNPVIPNLLLISVCLLCCVCVWFWVPRPPQAFNVWLFFIQSFSPNANPQKGVFIHSFWYINNLYPLPLTLLHHPFLFCFSQQLQLFTFILFVSVSSFPSLLQSSNFC